MLSNLGYGLRVAARTKNLLRPAFQLNGASLPADMIHSRSSTAHFQDAEGFWQQAAINAPRFGYIYGQGRGLIIEGAVTNRTNRTRAGLGTVNQAFLGGTTATTNGRNSTSIITDPDAPTKNLYNGTSIWRCVNPSGNAIELASTGAADTTTPTSIMIHYKHTGGTAAKVYLDNYSGTKTEIGALSTAGKWEVALIENIIPATSAQVLVIEIQPNSSMDICFINMQTSPVITSPIDQSGSTDLIRSADIVLDTNAAWYKDTAGTFIIEYYDRTPRIAANYQTLFYVGDGGNNNRLTLTKNISDGDLLARVVKASATALTQDFDSGAIISGFQKVGIAYERNNLALAVNGVIIKTSSSGDAPTSVTNGFSLGCYPNGAFPLNGIIRSFSFYNERLNNTALEGQTQNSVVAASASYDPHLSLILFGGQSGSSGAGNGSTSYDNMIYMLGNDGALKAYSDPYDINTGELFSHLSDPNAAFSYAGTVLNDLSDSGRAWAAVPANRWNTNIVTDWRPYPASGLNERVYELIQRGLLAKKYGVLKALVWDLGVSDAIAGTSQADFKAATQALFELVHSHLGTVPIILVTLHEWSGGTTASEANWNAIYNGQIELASALSYVTLVDISDLPGKSGEEYHLDNAQIIITGNRIAAVF